MSTKETVFATGLSMERTLLNGTLLASAIYGVHLTLFFECFHLLVLQPKQEKIKWHLVVLICANFILGTIFFTANLMFNELIFIDHRDHPGGPLGAYFNEYGNAWNLIAFATGFLSNWTSDRLLIYRLFMFWNGNRRIILLPCLALAGSVALGILLLVKIAHPSRAFWGHLAVHLGTSYWALTIAINVYVTVLIIGRVWYLQRSIDQIIPSEQIPPRSNLFSFIKFGWWTTLNKKDKPDDAFKAQAPQPDLSSAPLRVSLRKRNVGRVSSVISMLLESAALVTIIGAIFEGVYVSNSTLMNIFMPLLGQTGPIAALLIIVRVARGTAWTRDEVIGLSTIRFS